MRSLAFIPAMVVLLPAVLAVPSINVHRDAVQEVNVLLQFLKATKELDIAVTDKITAEKLGYACTHKLDSGAFTGYPISADVDENGAGNLTVGPNTHRVHEHPDVSGGITCARIFNDVESLISCAISIPTSLKLTPIDERDETNCFASGASPGLQGVVHSLLDGNASPSRSNLTRRDVGPSEQKRQDCYFVDDTSLVGNGNPHQNYFNKQLSENINCGAAPSCSVGEVQSQSYTIGWSATVSPFSWISGGFSVSQSWTTGNTYSCSGSAGDTVCIWYNIAHTAYTVQNGGIESCTGYYQADGNPFVMFSPNNGNVGGGYYCVVGPCRSQGQNYWNYNGRAGGP